jgi:glycosyltransferase involved in cell wall biosynthesis
VCKVSIIIPYYNRENTIIRALDSIKDQTFSDYEVILINDGSTDRSYVLVEEFIKNNNNIKINHITQKNSGPSKARNVGISNSRGKYIAFLDSDDSWEKDKLKIQVDFMERHENVSILGTEYTISLSKDNIIKSKETGEYEKAAFKKMLFKNFFCLPTIMVRRELFKDKEFMFDENKSHAEDQLFFLNIVRKFEGGKLKQPLTKLYKMEFGQGGLSGNLEQIEKNELDNLRRIYAGNKNCNRKLSLPIYLAAQSFSIIRHIRRTLIAKFIFKKI